MFASKGAVADPVSPGEVAPSGIVTMAFVLSETICSWFPENTISYVTTTVPAACIYLSYYTKSEIYADIKCIIIQDICHDKYSGAISWHNF